MVELGWLTRDLGDVPRHDRWLSEPEREALSALRVPKRRADWRLGRWTAKAAVAAWRRVPLEAVVVIAADDGAPEALIDGDPAAVALSLSHRAGRALAAVGDPRSALGCDLEALEPRSPAFLREWLAPAECDLVMAQAGEGRDLGGEPRLDGEGGRFEGSTGGTATERSQSAGRGRAMAQSLGSWARLRVTWENGLVESGWWRRDPGWVMALVSDPACESPPRSSASPFERASSSMLRRVCAGGLPRRCTRRPALTRPLPSSW